MAVNRRQLKFISSSHVWLTLFNFERHGTGALVEDGILGRVVKEARHGDALLVATRECISPLALHVPATLALDDVVHLDDFERADQVLIRLALGAHLDG